MSEEKKQPEKKLRIQEGYQPIKKGHQPTQGNLDSSKPPQGGSGVPLRPSGDSGKTDKKD